MISQAPWALYESPILKMNSATYQQRLLIIREGVPSTCQHAQSSPFSFDGYAYVGSYARQTSLKDNNQSLYQEIQIIQEKVILPLAQQISQAPSAHVTEIRLLKDILSPLLGFQTQKKLPYSNPKEHPVVDQKKQISRTLLAYRNKIANSFLETYFNFTVIPKNILCIEDNKQISRTLLGFGIQKQNYQLPIESLKYISPLQLSKKI